MITLRECLSEYTDKEKQMMGIPLNATSRGGVWYVGDKFAGKVEDGKFIPVEKDIEQQQTDNKQVIQLDYDVKELSDRGPTRSQFLSKLGINDVPYVETEDIKKEILEHGTIISAGSDETNRSPLHQMIKRWTGTSIWSRSEEERAEIFQEIDKAIDQHDLKIKTNKNLYRGIHFDKGNVGVTTDSIFSTYRPGEVIKMPPAGFTVDRGRALDFARMGLPSLAVLFELVNTPKGIQGIHISDSKINPIYQGEKEIITRSGEYKVSTVKVTPIKHSQSNTSQTENFMQEGADAMCVYVQLEQINDVKEQTTTENKKNHLRLVDLFMSDTMRGTEKNIKQIEKRFGNSK